MFWNYLIFKNLLYVNIIQKTGIGLFIIALVAFALAPFLSDYKITDASLKEIEPHFQDAHKGPLISQLKTIKDEVFPTRQSFLEKHDELVQNANELIEESGNNAIQEGEYWDKEYKFWTLRYAATGFFEANKTYFFILIFILGITGAFLHIIPLFRKGTPGIKHDNIYHNPATSRGWIGILTGVYFIIFYFTLYFHPYWFTESVSLADPVSHLFGNGDASHWFMYGFLYTIAILVMGVRMFAKYRHNRYHIIRTISIMFFQLGFAFLLPEILRSLQMPAPDLKNIWPLDYDFFYDYNLKDLLSSGFVGLLFLAIGLIHIFITVPLLTYFFGKRWYCSWVCGCGGLAETLGDPYRQLSDKSLLAWRVERYLVHGVLVFAVVMTGFVLYQYFTGSDRLIGISAYNIREIYGFGISSIFAGVVGTGFYPLMGNRVWCRFGCPLAAILGIIQKFKSRFRITANGDQCISCGNCSTYCEMGIDVKWYAQRGQNIVRASCVGCGVCAAVCPRGVLRLENGPDNPGRKGIQAIHISRDEVKILS